MELVYIYVKKFGDVIEDSEFNFSNKFNIEYDKYNNKLNIEKRAEGLYKFWGDNILNISSIVGKNGEGKSTILDLIGLKSQDRMDNAREYKDEYFFLYHKENNEFIIEGINRYLVNKSINNIPKFYNDKIIDYYAYLLCKDIEGNLEFYDHIDVEDHNGDSDNTRLVHINIRDSYTDRCSVPKYSDKEEATSKFIRIYSKYSRYINKYHTLRYLIEKNFITNIKNLNFTLTYKRTNNNELDINGINRILKREEVIEKKKLDKIAKRESKYIELSKKEYHILNCIVNYIYFLYEYKYRRIPIDIINNNLKEFNNNYLDIACFSDMYKYLLDLLMFLEDEDEYIDTKNMIKYINILNMMDEDIFSDYKMYIDIEKDINENIIRLLECIDSDELLKDIIQLNINGLSQGQKKIVDIFSNIFEVTKDVNLKSIKTIVLLLDEPDTSFHPEWSRSFITLLIDCIDKFNNNGKKYQIILTTHSPFIISDLPKENVILMSEGKVVDENLGNTLGSNIHMLLAKQFFMKSTIGEYAKKNIINTIEFFDNYNEIILEDDEKINLETKKKEIFYFINQIGEPIIKTRLERKYKKTFPVTKYDYEKKIRELELEKSKLETKISNDNEINIDILMELLKDKIDELKKISKE